MNKITNFLCLSLLLIGSASLGMDLDYSEQLFRASAAGNLELMKKLLELGTPITDESGCSAIAYAITCNKAKACELLLNHKANVNKRDESGMTPLGTACEFGHNAICQLLIDRNAHINTQDLHGYTPLMWASGREHIETCKLLIDAILKPIKPIKQKQKAALALVGMKKYRKARCMGLIDPQVIQLIAHQIYKPVPGVAQKIQKLFDQINAISDQKIKEKLLDYTRTQLNPQKQNNYCIIA
jgi:hypothetical protein